MRLRDTKFRTDVAAGTWASRIVTVGLLPEWTTRARLDDVKRKRRRTSTLVACPFCGQEDELFVDSGGGDSQVYTEDCAVCCRPRVVHVEPSDTPGEPIVWIERGE